MLLADPNTHRMAFEQIGLSIECAMKAVISRRKGYNEWPSPKTAPDLYGHNLRKMARFGDLFPPSSAAETAGHFQALLDWKRDKAYYIGKMDKRHVQRLYDSAFGPKGVMEWLASL